MTNSTKTHFEQDRHKLIAAMYIAIKNLRGEGLDALRPLSPELANNIADMLGNAMLGNVMTDDNGRVIPSSELVEDIRKKDKEGSK